MNVETVENCFVKKRKTKTKNKNKQADIYERLTKSSTPDIWKVDLNLGDKVDVQGVNIVRNQVESRK